MNDNKTQIKDLWLLGYYIWLLDQKGYGHIYVIERGTLTENSSQFNGLDMLKKLLSVFRCGHSDFEIF